MSESIGVAGWLYGLIMDGIVAGVGAVLAALGFAANQTQNGDVLFWINGFFTWVPGVIGIVVGVVFLFYKLNRERYYEILAKLKEKAE